MKLKFVWDCTQLASLLDLNVAFVNEKNFFFLIKVHIYEIRNFYNIEERKYDGQKKKRKKILL